MSQPTSDTINNLTRCLRLPGFFPGGYVDQFLRVLPFEDAGCYGRQVQINRATSATLGDTTFYDPGDTLAATQGSTTLTTFTFQRIAGTAQVDEADIAASCDPNEQLDLQVQMRRVSLLRSLSTTLMMGTGVAPFMAGLLTLVDAGQTIDLSGAAPTLADYHRLVSRVGASDGSIGDGGADALVMNRVARRQLISLYEAIGCACPYEADPVLGHPVLTIEGVPVYISDGLTDITEASIVAVTLKGPTGVRMLHAGGDSSDFGIVVDEVPSQLTVSQRAKVVRGYYAMCVPEIESLAAMIGADMTGFAP